jgi:hypothetical protein
LVGLLIVLVADPFGVISGNFSSDSYSQIRSELSKTKNAKVQLVASWDDFYSLEYNNYWRAEMSTEFVERNYGEVLDAASLGESYFNNYLQSKGITHLLIPNSSVQNGRIFHKFGVRGSIDISLQSPFLAKVASSSGPFAASLFQVTKNSQLDETLTDRSYLLAWNGVGSEFFSKKNTVTEVGMYRYDYNTYYENGPDVSWFYDESPDRPGYLELKFEASNADFEAANFEIEFVAAYGPNAPSHVVVFRTKVEVGSLTLKAGKPQKISVGIKNGESVRFLNGTPCRLPAVFEPADASLKEICFGITAVLVTPLTQVE